MLFEVLYRRRHPLFNDDDPVLCVELIDADSLEQVLELFQGPGNDGVDLIAVEAQDGEL